MSQTTENYIALLLSNVTTTFFADEDNLNVHESTSELTSSDNDDDENSFLASDNFKHAALILFYSLIIVLSIFGNTFVVRVMCRASPTTTNMLIINLAISDLLLTSFNM